MNLLGQSVTVDPGVDCIKTRFSVKTVRDGFTAEIGGSVVTAIQTLKSMGEAAGATKNKRVQAMAAATAAMAAKNAAADIAKNGASISISLTAGHSESEQTQTTTELSNTGTALAAGKNLNIVASGGGKDSNLNIVGSSVSAGGNINLAADNQVNLLAAQDLETQHSTSSSLSAAAGIGATIGTNGSSIGFTASVSASKGHEDGEGTTQVTTSVNAGKTLSISSGGDTNIRGAVAAGAQVVAVIGGSLNLEPAGHGQVRQQNPKHQCQWYGGFWRQRQRKCQPEQDQWRLCRRH
jgi:filamentous hemagglutinin